MKIYVDFDDILSETALYFSHLVKKMFGKYVPYENIKSFSLQKSFDLSDEEKFFRCSDWKKIDSLFQKCKNRCR